MFLFILYCTIIIVLYFVHSTYHSTDSTIDSVITSDIYYQNFVLDAECILYDVHVPHKIGSLSKYRQIVNNF